VQDLERKTEKKKKDWYFIRVTLFGSMILLVTVLKHIFFSKI